MIEAKPFLFVSWSRSDGVGNPIAASVWNVVTNTMLPSLYDGVGDEHGMVDVMIVRWSQLP